MGVESQSLSAEEVSVALIEQLDLLSSATVVFDGFSLPEEFGESNQLQFGNLAQLATVGLSENSIAMARSFVKKTIEELFAGEYGAFVPEGSLFILTQAETVFTVALAPSDRPPHSHK